MEKTFKVKGMHCNSCEMLIKDALEETDGVNSASASFSKGFVNVEFDQSKIDEKSIKKIIADEGFGVD